LVIGLIILFGVILDTYRRRYSEVRRAVQALRSKVEQKAGVGEQGAIRPGVEDGPEKPGASSANLRSGSRDKEKS
jgi:hypothetical protein